LFVVLENVLICLVLFIDAFLQLAYFLYEDLIGILLVFDQDFELVNDEFIIIVFLFLSDDFCFVPIALCLDLIDIILEFFILFDKILFLDLD
jgi:hypothetical protein